MINPDFGLLFWTLVSFSIVVFILGKFAWKPIMKSLKDREYEIENAIQSAKQAKVEMEQLQASNEKILLEAKSEREQLMKEAREVKETIIKDAKSQAAVEADKMLKTAKESIETEKAAAISDIKKQVTELSILIAEKILVKELGNQEDQKKYIDSLLKDINAN